MEKKKNRHKVKKELTLEEAVKEDEKYFKRQVEKGIKKLVGAKTKERVRNCIHCKSWNKAEKFIKEVLEII